MRETSRSPAEQIAQHSVSSDCMRLIILRRAAVALISKMQHAVVTVVADEHFIACQKMRPARLIESGDGRAWNNREYPYQLAIRVGGEYSVIGGVHDDQYVIRSDFGISGAVQLKTFPTAVERFEAPHSLPGLVDEDEPMITGIGNQYSAIGQRLRTMRIFELHRCVRAGGPGNVSRPVHLHDEIIGWIHDE